MATDVRQRPTRRQLEVLRTYLAAGSIAAAAHELDIKESTARQHLSGLYRRTGRLNAAQAAYWLGKAVGHGARTGDPDTCVTATARTNQSPRTLRTPEGPVDSSEPLFRAFRSDDDRA